jgi:hypothetical protein
MQAIRGHATITYSDGGTPVTLAAVTGAVLSIQTQTLSGANPDSYGWDYHIAGTSSWSLSAQHLQIVGTNGVRASNQRTLETAAFQRTRLSITFTTPYAIYTGQAYIDQLSVEITSGQAISGSYTFKGAGDLVLTHILP